MVFCGCASPKGRHLSTWVNSQFIPVPRFTAFFKPSLIAMEKHDAEKHASVELNDDLRDHTRDLPPPATAHHQQQPRARAKLNAAAIIPVWIVLSSGVIIYNNYIYNTLNFKFPVFLVTWHLTFAVSLLRLSLIAFFFVFTSLSFNRSHKPRQSALAFSNALPTSSTPPRMSQLAKTCSSAPFSPLAYFSRAVSSSAIPLICT